MARRKSDSYTNTQALPRMGSGAYSLAANASAADVRPGMLVPKTGNAKGGSEPVTANRRGQVYAQSTLGAQYRITATRAPYLQGDPQAPTQANGRIVPAVTGSQRNFRSARAYGPM